MHFLINYYPFWHYLIFTLLIILNPLTAQNPKYDSLGRYAYAYRIENIVGHFETMTNSRIYYPESSGQIPNSAIPCPIIVFGHGYQIGIDRYYSYAQHLASWGYVVVLPTISNPFPTPEHYTRARSMVDAARWTANKHFVITDLFYNKLAVNKWGFIGHSMGGGLALLAADTFHLQDTLTVVVSLASPQTTPATRPECLFVPKIILAGSVDNIAPWQQIRQAYWQNAPAPGCFAVINGANHGYFMDYSYFWENGGTATITRNQQQKISRKYMVAYCERYLHNDTSYWNYLFCYGDSIRFSQLIDSVEVRYNPVYLYELNDFASKNYPYLIYPNPAQNYLNIVGIGGSAKIFDIGGRLITKIQIPTRWSINAKLKNGVYFIKTNKQLIRFIIFR